MVLQDKFEETKTALESEEVVVDEEVGLELIYEGPQVQVRFFQVKLFGLICHLR